MGDKFGIAWNEASTYRGLVYLAMAFGIHITPEQQGAIVTAGLSVAAAISLFTKRKEPSQ
jgi:hypothetical protein